MAKKSETAKLDKIISESLKEAGFPYAAKYVEMFGSSNPNPSFSRGMNKGTEEFYKHCVEEGHPWDWYFEFPEDAIF